ncbi:UNVERIFIED_CONTAM: Galactan beta-1,4-galactosyltransferase GALS1 [Sesamum radiatum]|uniref:Galactan beta-1,4-galactosyltransferase GALS1 n=1 Tax=Sesamum radiatum TaxID=300843 RepID=A0AAW2Q2C3_SESRA
MNNKSQIFYHIHHSLRLRLRLRRSLSKAVGQISSSQGQGQRQWSILAHSCRFNEERRSAARQPRRQDLPLLRNQALPRHIASRYLVMVVWNLQPYYENLISATSRCSAATSATESLPIKSATLGGVTPLAEKKLVSSPPADPNKRTFQAYGNAAALFVQMGAYRGGPNTFAVVGLASKPIHVFGRPWYKCEWIPNNGNSSIRAKAYKMLPDWGYGRVYTVVVVNCTFAENPNADNSGGKLMVYAYYGESPRKYEKFTALEEAPGSYDESEYRPPYKYEYLYCGSSLYGNLSAARMREWMAYHAWFFGASSHFVSTMRAECRRR